jgi:pre-mycofactocin synthase
VVNVLDILRGGVDEALLGLGRTSVHDLVRNDLIIPDDFIKAGPRPLDPEPT